MSYTKGGVYANTLGDKAKTENKIINGFMTGQSVNSFELMAEFSNNTRIYPVYIFHSNQVFRSIKEHESSNRDNVKSQKYVFTAVQRMKEILSV